jgi:tetratricopeptide (TPR) repeat protein
MRTSVFLLMLGASASQAYGQTAPVPSRSDAYVAVLSTYVEQPAQAVRALSLWRTNDVERALAQIPRTTAGSIVLTGGESAERMLERMALLHAETALTSYERDDIDAMRAHLEWSRRIVHHDLPWPTPGDAPRFVVNPKFGSDWALTIVGFFQMKLAFSEARRFLDQELKTGFLDRAGLLLARGMTEEIAASERALPRTDSLRRPDRNDPSRLRAPRPGDNAARRSGLADATDFYRQAITANSSLHTARLRLGRVLLELGHEADALVELQRVFAENDDQTDRYLVNLFLASLHERNGRVGDATFHFKAAAALFRSAQTPYLGLSHLQMQRDPTGAADTLQVMFDHHPEPTRGVPDPWWLYDAGFGASFQSRLEQLRARVSTP